MGKVVIEGNALIIKGSRGCFSSPPEDCGADCVASFKKDEGCYQCCCMESPGESIECDRGVSL